MLTRLLVAGTATLTATAPAAVAAAAPAAPAVRAVTTATVNGRIAYVSDQGGKPEIWVMDADGQNPHRLIASPTRDFDPAWSPDGTMIAFGRRNADSVYTDIWVAWADGSHQRKVTSDPDIDESPAWSPDGKQIAYTRGEGSAARVWVTRLATGAARRVSQDYETRSPSWAAGDLLAVSSRRTGVDAHYVIREISLTRGTTQPLADFPDEDLVAPVWSPSGRSVAAEEVYVTQDPYSVSHSVGIFDFTTGAFNGWGPALDPGWSPDGRLIAYDRPDHDGSLQVVSLTLDPGHLTPLSPEGGANEYEPSWQRVPHIVCPRPVLHGKARVGKRLRAVQGTVHPALTRTRFSWLRGKHRIKGATTRHHRVTRKDLGRRIRVRVRCTVVGATGPVVVTSKARRVRR